jgi:hypothetical protein
MLLVLAVLAGAIHGALSVRPEDHVGRRRLASGKLARFTFKVQYLLALHKTAHIFLLLPAMLSQGCHKAT